MNYKTKTLMYLSRTKHIVIKCKAVLRLCSSKRMDEPRPEGTTVTNSVPTPNKKKKARKKKKGKKAKAHTAGTGWEHDPEGRWEVIVTPEKGRCLVAKRDLAAGESGNHTLQELVTLSVMLSI